MANKQENIAAPSGISAAPNAKDLLVFVPLLGSALALIYDSGYFSGLGAHYFTLFSINEHIAFALQILPIALASAMIASLYVIWRGRDMTARLERLSRHPALSVVLFALPTVGLFFLLSKIISTNLSIASLAATTAFFVGYLPIRILWRAMLAAVLLIVVVFNFGRAIAAFDTDSDRSLAIDILKERMGYLRKVTTLNTTDGQTISAHVLRSGERGVLYFDLSSRRVVLLSWTLISKISTP